MISIIIIIFILFIKLLNCGKKIKFILLSCSVTVSTGRFRRDPRQIEEEEEIWFNNEDDEFDDAEAVVPHTGMADATEITASDQLDSIGKFYTISYQIK